MTSLQLGLIAAGAALVGGVLVYNWVQERRIRRRIDEAFRQEGDGESTSGEVAHAGSSGRVEPTLPSGRGANAVPENALRGRGADGAQDDDGYEPPLEIQDRIASDMAAADSPVESWAADAAPAQFSARAPTAERNGPQPDPDIECIVILQPVRPVSAGALAAGLHARLGRPLRWFGRRGAGLPWQLLKSDTVGEFAEVAACLLLANRAGAASRPLLESYFHVISEIASGLPAAFVAPDAAAEAARAEALDRICADLDVQIGLTLLKTGAAMIPGTRLRGIAEAAGFRLTEGGRFDWIQEETGAVLYSLQNYRSEPFTAGHAAHDVDAGRGLPARRSARHRTGARLRPDEARREAHGADARRDARRRQSACARRRRAQRHPRAGAQHRGGAARGSHRAGQPARAGAVRWLNPRRQSLRATGS